MSGDVQPRKRKDKRRKKDEAPGPEEPIVQAAASPIIEDFNIIHVHNDHGTGGGICAKLVFFVLLSILAVLIGMILVEKRGLTDLETAPSESRFAEIFEGWIDESVGHHEEDHAHDELIEHDDHDEHEEHEASEEASVEHDEEHDEHEEEHLSEEQVSQEAVTEEELEEAEDELDDTEEQAASQEEEEEQVVSQEEEEQQEDAEDEQEGSEEKQEDDEEIQTLIDDDNTGEDVQASNEDEAGDNDDDNEAADTNEDNDEKDDNDNTAEEEDNLSNREDDIFEEDATDNFSEENDIVEEDSAENTADDVEGDDQEEEEVVDNTAGEEDALKEEAEKKEEIEVEESSSMAVKFGVGVALLVVAHVVLVRKWRSGKPKDDKPKVEEEETITDLSRRNTIVAPVPLEQIENDIQNLDEDEYSEEEEEESEEEIIESIPVKKSYQELQSTYSRTLPPETITKTKLESSPVAPKKALYAPQPDEEEEEEEEEDEEVEDEEEVEEIEEDAEEGDEEGDEEEGDEEEGDENEEDISDVDDDELLKKLEARYGKLPATGGNSFNDEEENDNSSSWKRIRVLPDEESEESDDDPWTKKSTVPADLQQKLKLAEANLRDLQNPDLAHKLFTNLMEQLPSNNRIKYGLAQSLDQLAELRRSNQLLQDAISSYYDILQSSTISDKLYLKVAERCIDRIRFRGHYGRAVQLHKAIINRFPNNSSHRNQLAVTLLTSNRLAEAKTVLEEVLAKWPNDGFALAHYGFILKTKDNNMHEAVKYLRRGIESRMPGVIDGRFYFHLGDALQRLGKNDEAMLVYEDGVKHNVFLSKYQRSLYNVDRLTGIPWWPINQTPYASFFKLLEEKWKTIREEGLVLLSKAGFFKDEAENLRDTGQWKQFELFARGHKFVENCKKCPQTCRLIENFPDAKSCKRGQVKFSVMHPGTHVWPHCGPSNCRLRAHLGLKVPPGTFIRVADETRSWSEGKVFIFDDSFEHEVWHNGSEVRLVLIVDVWHPELTEYEKRSLPAI